MLIEVEIEILVGAGDVALAATETPRLHYLPNAPEDIDAIIKIRDNAVIIEPRKHQALRVDDGYLPMAEPYTVPRAVTATLAAVGRRLSVRTFEVPHASLLSGELVIRNTSRSVSAGAPVPSRLTARVSNEGRRGLRGARHRE